MISSWQESCRFGKFELIAAKTYTSSSLNSNKKRKSLDTANDHITDMTNDRMAFVVDKSQQGIISKQPILPPLQPPPSPPPPPPQEEQIPPFQAVSDNEWIDMDKLIGQTLYNLEKNSFKTSNNSLSSMDYTPKSFRKPLSLPNTTVDNLLQAETIDHHSVISQRSDPSSLSSKCTAPIVPIVHHKCTNHDEVKKINFNDSFLQKERDELEAKLAKQREKKSIASIKTIIDHAAATFDDNNIEESGIISKTEKSQPSTNSLSSQQPPPVLPKTISIDLNFIESQQNDSRKPLTISKKSTSFKGMNQSLSSPTCSNTSQSLINNDGDELAAKLARRNMIAEGEPVEQAKPPKLGIYSEFHEFTRKQIKYFMETFKKYDEDHDNYIDFNELKRMMEKLGEAQTHIALKNMLKLVDEDQDGKVSPREFMLIFRYASTGQLSCAEIFNELAASVDVIKEGVHAAADFFEAKIEEQTKLSKFEEEIRAEQEEKRLQQAKKKERRQQFLANKAVFI
ncbi:EF-hand domain-containing protein [Dirofilaria immitis]